MHRLCEKMETFVASDMGMTSTLLRHWPPTRMFGRLSATTKLGSPRLILLCRIQSNQLVATSHEVLKHSQPLHNLFANTSHLHIAHKEYVCLHWWNCSRVNLTTLAFGYFFLIFFLTNLWTAKAWTARLIRPFFFNQAATAAISCWALRRFILMSLLFLKSLKGCHRDFGRTTGPLFHGENFSIKTKADKLSCMHHIKLPWNDEQIHEQTWEHFQILLVYGGGQGRVL